MNPTLLGFVLGWLGSMPLAGPVSVLVVKRGLAGRARCGIALAVGAALAETGWCAAALFGYGALLDSYGWWVRPAAGGVGGIIMVGLGLRMLLGRSLVRDDPTAPEAPRRSWPREFAVGFSIVLVNVSVLLSWIGVLTALHALGLDGPLKLESASHSPRFSFVAGVPLGIISWFTLLLWLMAHTGARVRQEWIGRAVRWLGGILLLAGTWALILVGRRLLGK